MKLPARDDPGGDREGSLPRDKVLRVLEENDVEIVQRATNKYVLSLEDVILAVTLHEMVGGITVGFLGRNFNIDTVKFYFDHSELDPGPSRKLN